VITGPFDAHFDAAFAECPLIAILRGLEPEHAEQTGQVLIDAGFRIIEVPLNSPDPFDSISRLIKSFGHHALIGAGTVTQLDEVGTVRAKSVCRQAGGRLAGMDE
jgi:2-dehydro-3-deoxyphosphogalactonate aldolase